MTLPNPDTNAASTPVAAFAQWFLGLSEKDRFAAGKAFREETGGTLSAWANPLPVPVALIPVRTADGASLGLLGVRRTVEPAKGKVALPGGFATLGEDPATGAAREVREETGIEIDPGEFTTMDGLPRLAHNGGWLCFLRCQRTLTQDEVVQANARLAAAGDGEASELVIIEPDLELGFPLHAEAAARFFTDMAPLLRPRAPAVRPLRPR